MRELHLEERPTKLNQLVGQTDAVMQLKALAQSEEGLPHTFLFTGPSGCGKTTLGRIIRKKLRCGDADFVEVNAANDRGVGMVRHIQQHVGMRPIAGNARVWLIDECHQLTAEAQGAFLKLLEEPPGHVYFMLATTNPEKLKKTIRTRCTEIKVRSLTGKETIGLVQRVAKKRNDLQLDDTVATKLGEVADGSARKALVLLSQIIGIDEVERQINILQKADVAAIAFEVAQALMRRKGWSTISKLLKANTDEPEGTRRLILAYFTTVALGGGKQTQMAIEIMEEFEENFYDSGKAGLVMACFRACNR